MPEKQRAANRRSPQPGAGRGSAPRGFCSLACVPGRPRAGMRARRAPCTQTRAACTRNVHTPRATCTQTCEGGFVRAERQARAFPAHTTRRSLHNAPGSLGDVCMEAGARAEPDCGHKWSWKASKRRTRDPGTVTRACRHRKALLTEHVPRTRSQRHTERTRHADMHTCRRSACRTASPLLRSTKLAMCVCRMETLF